MTPSNQARYQHVLRVLPVSPLHAAAYIPHVKFARSVPSRPSPSPRPLHSPLAFAPLYSSNCLVISISISGNELRSQTRNFLPETAAEPAVYPLFVRAGQENLPGGAGRGLPQLFLSPLGTIPDAGRPRFLRPFQHGHGDFASKLAMCARELLTRAQVLNALSIDPGRQWKGVWRWFSETQLQVLALHRVFIA